MNEKVENNNENNNNNEQKTNPSIFKHQIKKGMISCLISLSFLHNFKNRRGRVQTQKFRSCTDKTQTN